MSNSINTAQLRKMFLCGAYNLQSNKAWINELNVFPVPDGDTGTNMTMTVVSAVNEVANLGETDDMKAVCKAISSGSLRGARGNSGVILSQLFRGFCKIVRDHAEIDVPLCADAFDKAVETAYKAVMKPKEGTILTVAKGAALKSRELADAGELDFDNYIPQVIEYAESVLASTPDMLPVLKQAGVVDSGGQGLVQVLKGAYEAYQGKEVSAADILERKVEDAEETQEAAKEELQYVYCVELSVRLDRSYYNGKTEADLKSYLANVGERAMTAVNGDDLKIHIHTNDPGLVIQKALMFGDLTTTKVDNLKEVEHKHILSYEEQKAAEEAPAETPVEEMPHKEIGIIAVAAGDGLAQLFTELGVDYVISGGQTMNPSTEDILNAANKVNADAIIVLPNNKNIIMAANQAALINQDKKIVVVPTKTVAQGITAAINFMPDQDVDVNASNMQDEITHVKTCEVTYAVRDTMIDDVEIKMGNMMAIGDAGILAVGEDCIETSLEATKKMVEDTTELISIYFGADTKEEDAEVLRGKIAEAFPNCEVELQNGGQPVYYYLISAE